MSAPFPAVIVSCGWSEVFFHCSCAASLSARSYIGTAYVPPEVAQKKKEEAAAAKKIQEEKIAAVLASQRPHQPTPTSPVAAVEVVQAAPAPSTPATATAERPSDLDDGEKRKVVA